MIETKTVDFKVKGKDGLVNVHTIQRHKPYFPMCFIRTVTGHMLFCQENHPVCIKLIDGQDTVVEAKDVVMFHDRIWVDNSDTLNEPIDKTHNIIQNEDDYKWFIDKFLTIINGYEVKNILQENKCFLGDSLYNFYINPVVLNDLCDIDQYVLFTQLTKIYSTQYSTPQRVRIFSFNLVSQLKNIADKLGINCIFDINLSIGNEVFWSLKDFGESDKDTLITEYIDVEQVISGIDGYQGYVYDLKTETEEFMNNNVQTHNSFHTGGAVEFKKIDILKELGLNIDSSEETHLKRLFNQVDNDFFCNNALTKIVINKTLFQDEYAIKKEGDVYKLPLGYFVLTTGEIILDATIEQPIVLSIPTDYSETATTIELVYGQGDKILHIKSFSIAPEKIAQHLDSLVGGKSPYTTPESLLRKFHNDLEGFNFYDMTHLEVIVSSVLRNKLDPMIPARLKEPYNPETFSIKALPGVISWSLGLAYENISKALSTGLISDDVKNLSQIEKVLYGEPLSDLSHELLAAKRKKK